MSLVFKTPQSTLNTTTGLGQNIGSGCPPCPECPEVDLTTGSAEYTENGEYTLTPEGDGFSSVDVTVNVDVTTPYNNGVAAGEAAQKAKLESATFVSNGTYTKEDGYNSVTVNVPSDINNQEKNATPTTSSQEIVADNGYSGLSKVTISGVTSAIDSNISAGNIKKDVAILGVTGTYDPQPTLQDKTVAPTTSQQVISADSGYDGLDEVTVSAVTSAIDSNIAAGNIKSGVTILGVQGTVQEGITPTGNINITDTSSTNVTNYATAQVVDANLVASNIKNGVSILGVSGSYDPQPDLETKTVTYTANDTYTITPTAGKDGMSSVEVTVNVSGGSGTQCPDWSSIGWDCSDVENSSLAADVAYAAQKKAEFEAGTIDDFHMDKNLVYAPKIVPNHYNTFQSCSNLKYVPAFDSIGTYGCHNLFSGCTALKSVPLFDTSNITDMDFMFGQDNTSLQGKVNYGAGVTTVPQYDMSNVTSALGMFRGCVYLTTIPDLNTPKLRDIVYYVGSNVSGSIFSGCLSLIAIPNMDLTNVTDMSHFAIGQSGIVSGPSGDMALKTVPLLNTPNVARIKDAFWKCPNITTLGGFTNLGKAFVSTDATKYHILDLSSSTVLTKQSIMNVINNLAAPDDTDVSDAQLMLSATSYALLDAEDIAIATAKNWAVTSA